MSLNLLGMKIWVILLGQQSRPVRVSAESKNNLQWGCQWWREMSITYRLRTYCVSESWKPALLTVFKVLWKFKIFCHLDELDLHFLTQEELRASLYRRDMDVIRRNGWVQKGILVSMTPQIHAMLCLWVRMLAAAYTIPRAVQPGSCCCHQLH